jgi:hypothetical protein
MKKKGYSYLDYYGLSQYLDVIEDAKEKLKEQIRLRQIEESRRLAGGNKGIHKTNEIT